MYEDRECSQLHVQGTAGTLGTRGKLKVSVIGVKKYMYMYTCMHTNVILVNEHVYTVYVYVHVYVYVPVRV